MPIRKNTHVPNGCDRDGVCAESGGRDGEEVRIKAIGMNNLDSFPANCARKPQLLCQRTAVIHTPGRVDGNGHIQCFDIFYEWSDPAQACDAHVEPGAVQTRCRVHKLPFGSTHPEMSEKLHYFDFAHAHDLDARGIPVRMSNVRCPMYGLQMYLTRLLTDQSPVVGPKRFVIKPSGQ